MTRLTAVAVAAYLSAALILGLLPVNTSFRQARNGITIFVRTNGVHTDLALPVHTATIDWSREFPAAHFAGPVSELSTIGFGWGDRDFYVQTRTWGDVRIIGAASAFLGLKATTLHVQYMEPRTFSGEHIGVVITAAQYERLAAYVTATLRRDDNGSAIPIAGANYAALDAFYEAKGSYSAYSTCNDWVRRGLSEAGIRTPSWAPFDVALFYQLRAIPQP